MHAFIAWLMAFAARHEGVLGLLVLAFIATMPEQLPVPFNRVPILVFAWCWIHDGLKTFVNFRSPQKPQQPRAASGEKEPHDLDV